MQLNVPVHQTITLPDEWQACKTPQELSYWLIAKLDGIQAAIDELSGGGGDLTELQEQVTALQTKVNSLNDRVVALTQTTIDVQGGIEENKTNIATNTSNIATLRTDLQTTNENLSGFEDRVNTNSANIQTNKDNIELNTTAIEAFSAFNTQLQALSYESVHGTWNVPEANGGGTITASFSFISKASNDYTAALTTSYADAIASGLKGATIPCTGVYRAEGVTEVVIYAVRPSSEGWTSFYFIGQQAGMAVEKRFPLSLTPVTQKFIRVPFVVSPNNSVTLDDFPPTDANINESDA